MLAYSLIRLKAVTIDSVDVCDMFCDVGWINNLMQTEEEGFYSWVTSVVTGQEHMAEYRCIHEPLIIKLLMGTYEM